MRSKRHGLIPAACLLLLAGLLSRPSVLAQSPNPVPSAESGAAGDFASSGVPRVFDRYVLQGGWVTIFGLVPLSIAAVAFMLQYAVQIRRATIVPQPLIDELKELFASNRYGDAIQLVNEEPSAIGDVLHRGLTTARDGVVAMEQAMEDALEEHAIRYHRKLEYLNLIGSVAPMIGLFGTVHGIIGMFGSIADSGGIPIMSKISADLGTALVATFWGLLIAIPSLTCFGILRSRVDILMGECATAVESLTARFRLAAGSAPSPNPTARPVAARSVSTIETSAARHPSEDRT